MQRSCNNCSNWSPVSAPKGKGECRLNPPTVTVFPTHKDIAWPETDGVTGWCGQFEQYDVVPIPEPIFHNLSPGVKLLEG
jgi:hypothetical protein